MDEFLDSIMDWFESLRDYLPEAGQWAYDIIVGPIPKADAAVVYDLAERWGDLAQELNTTFEDVMTMADPILQNWSGDGAAVQFVEQWYSYVDGLRSTAESAAQMQQLTQNFGLEVELMKFMAALNLLMLAFSLIMMIAAAGPTFGGSLAGAAGAFLATKQAIMAGARKTISTIASWILRLSLKVLTKGFEELGGAAGRKAIEAAGRKAAELAARHAAEAAARAAARTAAREVAEATGRNALSNFARGVIGRGIAKGTANKLAAQALRGVAGRTARNQLGRQTTRAVQKELAKQIEKQLLKNWAGKEIRKGTENLVIRELAESVATKSLGREFAKHVGTRVAFGAGFMGGGNLLGQLIQVGDGHRQSLDWGQVGTTTIQGAAFGAGMFGGVTGHMVGGALAGGGLELGTELAAGKGVDWGKVGHGAVQGAGAGAIFGSQARLEHSTLGTAGLKVGDEVHVLPGGEKGDFHIVAGRGDRGVVLTSDGLAGWQAKSGERTFLGGVEERSDVMNSVNQHWKAVDTPARLEPSSSTSGGDRSGSGSRQSVKGDGEGGGPGDRMRVTGGDSTPTGDRSTADPAANGHQETTSRPEPTTGDRTPAAEPSTAPRDGGPPDGGGPPRDGTSIRPEQQAARPEEQGARPEQQGGTEHAPARQVERLPADRTAVRPDTASPRAEATSLAERPPVADQPTADPPIGDRPAAERPTADRPAPDRPVNERSALDRSAGDRPPAERPASERSNPAARSVDRAPVESRSRDGGGPVPDRTGEGSRGEGQEHRRDDASPSARPTDHGTAPESAPRADHHASRAEVRPVEGRHEEAVVAPHPAGDEVPAARPHEDGRPPDGPPPDGPPHVNSTHEPVMRSAGAEHGLAPTEESIRHGTVRMEEHPDFFRDVAFLDQHGFALVSDPEGPRAVLRHVYSLDGKTLIAEEREVRYLDGMRYLDFEHELDHVRQLVDRFDGKLATEAFRERANGVRVALNAKDVLSDKLDTVVEYHVRLAEAIRLIDRGVDPSIIREHLQGVNERLKVMNRSIGSRDRSAQAWKREYFPDISELERQLQNRRVALDIEADLGSPSQFRDGGPRMAKSPGTRPEPGQPDTGRPEAGDTGPMDRSPGRPLTVEAPRLVGLDGPVLENPVSLPREVSDLAGHEISGLFQRSGEAAPDQVAHAEWDPGSRTLRVEYGDGAKVDVVVQVNESVPAGRAVVVRPGLELVDGHWRQTGPAGVVLSPHVPGEVGARAAHVHDAMADAWRTLHGEVGDQLRPHDEAGGDGGPPPDHDPAAPEAHTHRVAHEAANKLHNRQDDIPARAGEDLDIRYGRHSGDGDPGRLPEDPRGRDSGGVPVRPSRDGPDAGDREIHAGGHSGGRDSGPDVRGGAHEDPADPARAGELAGGRDLRGVDLRGLEDPVGPDLPVRDADVVGRHEAVPAEPARPEGMTPDGVRQALNGRDAADPRGHWAQDHLADRADDGSLRPKSAEEIDSIVRGLADEALDRVTPADAVPVNDEHPDGQRPPGQEGHDPAAEGPRGHRHEPGEDLYSRGAARTNEDVFVNGSDVPFDHDAVAHVAELMGIDLSNVDIHLVNEADEIRYLDYQQACAVTPAELGGRQIRFGPAAFADAETLAATVAHEYTHVLQLREGRELSTESLRVLEDEAYASEGPALERFRQGFERWGNDRGGSVLDRGSLRPSEPGRPPGVGEGARGRDLDGGDPAGRGDRGGGEGAGRGVRDAEGPRAGSHDSGGGAHEPDAGGYRPSPYDLNRPIGGRPEGEPPVPRDESGSAHDPESRPEHDPRAEHDPQAEHEAPVEVADSWGIPEFPRTLPDNHPLLRSTDTINTPEREAFRQGVVDEVLGDAHAPESGKPVVYLMGGGGASGKGFVLEQLQHNGTIPHENVVHLDPDGIKATKIPEYAQIVGAGDSRAAAVVHEESSALAKRILAEAIERRASVIYDVTLGDPAKAIATLQRLHAEGYEIRLFGVSADADVAVLRNSSRAAETGRYVPIDMQLTAHRGFSRGFEAYADLADSVQLYDTNGAAPVPVAIKALGDHLRVLDTERYASFQHKGDLDPHAEGPASLFPEPREIAPSAHPHTGEAYVDKAMENLGRTSRTAAGTIDTSASVEKAGQMAADLSGDRAASLALGNYREVLGDLYAQRHVELRTPAELREMVEQRVREVNSGILQEGVLYREHDSTKYPSYTAAADIPAAAEQFFNEFHQRLNDPKVDPVELAAWVEYRMDLTDHLWADGCGKSAKAIAAWVLMRHDHDLPTYPTERAAQFAHAPKLPRAAGDGVDAVQYREWVDYYRGLFEGPRRRRF